MFVNLHQYTAFCSAQFHRQDEIEEEEPIVSGDSPEIKQPAVSRFPRKTKQMTFIDFLNE